MNVPKGGVLFFDSGIGGLTVLTECRKRLPATTFYYYGDNARAPYGNLPSEQIEQYVLGIFEELAWLQPRTAVIACNTVTALCIETLRKKYPFPIIGAEPAVLSAAKGGGEIFVLATKATCESARFRALCQRAIKKYPNASLRPFAIQSLAGTIERHLTDRHFNFFPLFPKGKPTSVVLGCTHYVFIKEQIGAFYNAPTYDGNAGIASRLQNLVDNSQNPLYGLNCGEPFSHQEGGLSHRDGRPLLTTTPFYAPIHFLGSHKTFNEHIFEQMFAKISR